MVDGAPHVIRAARVRDQVVLLELEDVTDRDSAERLRGKDVEVPRHDAPRLPRGQYFWHQVIGLRVEDAATEQRLGTVTDILETGANDVYVVTSESGRELLIPAIKDVVLDIDPSQGRMLVALLPGMT